MLDSIFAFQKSAQKSFVINLSNFNFDRFKNFLIIILILISSSSISLSSQMGYTADPHIKETLFNLSYALYAYQPYNNEIVKDNLLNLTSKYYLYDPYDESFKKSLSNIVTYAYYNPEDEIIKEIISNLMKCSLYFPDYPFIKDDQFINDAKLLKNHDNSDNNNGIRPNKSCKICNVCQTGAYITDQKLSYLIKHDFRPHLDFIKECFTKRRKKISQRYLSSIKDNINLKDQGFTELTNILKWFKYKPEIVIAPYKLDLLDLIMLSNKTVDIKLKLISDNNLKDLFFTKLFAKEKLAVELFNLGKLKILEENEDKIDKLEDFIFKQNIGESQNLEEALEYFAAYYWRKANNLDSKYEDSLYSNKALEYATKGMRDYSNINCMSIAGHMVAAGMASKNTITNNYGIEAYKVRPDNRLAIGVAKELERRSILKDIDGESKVQLAGYFLARGPEYSQRLLRQCKDILETGSDQDKYFANFILARYYSLENNLSLAQAFNYWKNGLEVKPGPISNMELSDKDLFFQSTVLIGCWLAEFKDRDFSKIDKKNITMDEISEITRSQVAAKLYEEFISILNKHGLLAFTCQLDSINTNLYILQRVENFNREDFVENKIKKIDATAKVTEGFTTRGYKTLIK